LIVSAEGVYGGNDWNLYGLPPMGARNCGGGSQLRRWKFWNSAAVTRGDHAKYLRAVESPYDDQIESALFEPMNLWMSVEYDGFTCITHLYSKTTLPEPLLSMLTHGAVMSNNFSAHLFIISAMIARAVKLQLTHGVLHIDNHHFFVLAHNGPPRVRDCPSH
jgi:hypothetical protein